MKMITDDDIYRARLIYLGPPGYTLPIQLPYAQWGLFIALVCTNLMVFVGASGNVLASGVAIAVAVFLTYYIWSFVNPDRPVRVVLRVAFTDWRSIRQQAATKTRFSSRHIRWTDIPRKGRR
jgi:hypothetical protein